MQELNKGDATKKNLAINERKSTTGDTGDEVWPAFPTRKDELKPTLGVAKADSLNNSMQEIGNQICMNSDLL